MEGLPGPEIGDIQTAEHVVVFVPDGVASPPGPASAGEFDALAERLVEARSSGRPIPAWGTLTLEDAYRVQRLVTARRLARGERLVGWKLGYTSEAMRRQMGVDAPNAGPLTDAMLLPDAGTVPAGALQPLVEPEIAVRLAGAPGPDPTPGEVAGLVDGAWAALEVCDPVWEGRRFTLEDNTADGSSAAWFVLGDELEAADLASVEVVLSRNGERVYRATGAAAGGDPLAGVSWLARLLAARGDRIEPGSVVLTGGLTTGVDLGPGDRVAARFRGPVGTVAGVSVGRDGVDRGPPGPGR